MLPTEPPANYEPLRTPPYFLQGGGELGAITRSIDWSSSPLGNPETWPQSLRTTLGILLNSAFPMFLFWGPELLCFYNDAYRPSLGDDGKHPCVGKPGRSVWPESWSIIGPQIEKALHAGGNTFHEDQPVPVYRNGQLEQVYWTYSYSPVYDENGEAAGVFVACTETTEKVRESAGLLESERSFRGILAQAPDPILILKGEDMVLTLANEPLFKVWNVGKNAIGKAYLDILPEMKDQGYLEMLRDVYHHDKIIKDYERRAAFIRDDGSEEVMYFNSVYQPYRENDGTISGVLVMASDVTGQVLARQKLEESEKRFRALVTTTADVVYRMSADWSELWELDGKGFLPSTEAPLRGWIQHYVHPDDRNMVEEAFARAVQAKTTFALEHQVLRADGTPGWTFSRAVPILNEAGDILEWFGAASDITERKQIEKDLRIARDSMERSKRLYETITDNTPDLVYVFDLNYRFTYANRALLAMWGRSWEDSIGQGLRVLGYEEWHAAMHEREIDQIVATRQPVRGTVTFPHAELGTRYYDYILTPVIGESGEVEAVAGTTRDVTDFKAAEEALRESEERYRHLAETLERKVDERTAELLRSNEDLQQFAHVASHDLKEPVRKILTFANMLGTTDGGLLSDRGSMSLQKVHSAAERMMNMVNGVLAYSKLAATDEPWEPVKLDAVIANVEADLEVLIQQKGAAIETGSLPVVKGAPVLLHQLFYNLLNNSLKFSRPETPLRIAINGQLRDDGTAEIVVADNGIGFEPEYAESIFKTFTRLHAKDQYEGTGLGLSLCRRIAERHGGSIRAEGLPGAGAVFTIVLPAAEK